MADWPRGAGAPRACCHCRGDHRAPEPGQPQIAKRKKELAIGLAIGATARHIAHGPLAGPGFWTGAGLAAGLAAGSAGSMSLRSFLFGVDPLDATTYTLVGIMTLVMIVIPALVTLRAALIVDPIESLQQ